jgi:hypothetical protein
VLGSCAALAASKVCCSKGLPVVSNKSFLGNRVDANRAGITTALTEQLFVIASLSKKTFAALQLDSRLGVYVFEQAMLDIEQTSIQLN